MPRTTLDQNDTFLSRYRKHTVLDATGVTTFLSESNQTHSSMVRRRNTSNTPGYRTYKPSSGKHRELLPMNFFRYEEYEVRRTHGLALRSDAGQTTRETGPLHTLSYCSNPGLPSASIRDAVDQQAVVKVRARLKDQNVNLGVALAEGKKTGVMLLNTASRIGGTLRSLKAGDFGKAYKILTGTNAPPRLRSRKSISQSQALANDWLALQFGWKPLLSDLYGSFEELATYNQRKLRTRVSASHTYRYMRKSNNQWNGIDAPFIEVGSFTTKYVIVFSHMPTGSHQLSAMGLTNPLSVAWELVPWSFVVDWFIPFGSYLDSLDATNGLVFEKGCKTVFFRAAETAQANATKVTGTRIDTMDARSWGRTVYCERNPISGFPSPIPPSFLPRITLNRGISMVALLRQRLKL